MSAPELQAVVFDLDGTLLDSQPLWETAEIAVAAAHGATWSRGDADDWFGRPLRGLGRAMADRGVPLTADETVSRLLDEVARSYELRMPWMPGARDLLAGLRAEGVPTALGTMCFRRLALAARAQAPAGALEIVVGGDEVTQGKPDPEVFTTAAARLGVDPRACVVVEDSPTGIRAARASGATVVAVPERDDAAEFAAAFDDVHVVRSLEELTPARLREIHAARGAARD